MAVMSRKQKFKKDQLPDGDLVNEQSNRDISRALSLLSAMVDFCQFKQSDIEDNIGNCRTYLTKLFDGKIELKTLHVVQICRTIGFPVALFWQIVMEEQTMDFDEFDNSMVRRMKNMLITIYSKKPVEMMNKTDEQFTIEEGHRRPGDLL